MKLDRGLFIDFALMLAVAVMTLVVYGIALDRIQLWGWILAGTAVAAAVAHALAPAVRDADIKGLGALLSLAGFLWLFMGLQGLTAAQSDVTPVSALGNLSAASCLLRLSNAHFRGRVRDDKPAQQPARS